jgi:hypothetical protein
MSGVKNLVVRQDLKPWALFDQTPERDAPAGILTVGMGTSVAPLNLIAFI